MDDTERIKKIRELCEQADLLRKTAEDLCKQLTETMADLAENERPHRSSDQRRR